MADDTEGMAPQDPPRTNKAEHAALPSSEALWGVLTGRSRRGVWTVGPMAKEVEQPPGDRHFRQAAQRGRGYPSA